MKHYRNITAVAQKSQNCTTENNKWYYIYLNRVTGWVYADLHTQPRRKIDYVTVIPIGALVTPRDADTLISWVLDRHDSWICNHWGEPELPADSIVDSNDYPPAIKHIIYNTWGVDYLKRGL